MDLTGLKVMFINMPIREGAPPNNPPLGILLLATILRQFGAIITILDLNIHRPFLEVDEIRDLMINYEAQDLIGLSGLITTLKWQTEVARIVKDVQPNTFLVSGGGLASEVEEKLLEWVPLLDAVAIGEGDFMILDIASDVKRSRTKQIYRGDHVKDLNALPFPDFDLLGREALEIYLKNPVWGVDAINNSVAPFLSKRSTSITTSRGCPFGCEFCWRGTQGGKCYAKRSATNIFEEMKFHLEKYRVDFIGWLDDNALFDKRRIVELAPLLKSLKVPWGAHLRLDEADKRIVSMAEAGGIYAGFGGESASANVLEMMGKGGQTLSRGSTKINGFSFPVTMVEGIKNTFNAGIHGNCTWMMGWPEETLKDLKTTVAFIKWQESFYPDGSVNKSIFVATAYPGTKLFLRPEVQKKLLSNFKTLQDYVLQLGDATEFIPGLNFSAMSDKVFLQAREYIENNEIFKILDM